MKYVQPCMPVEELLQAETCWWLRNLHFCAPSCTFTHSTLRLPLSVDESSIQFHFDFCSCNSCKQRRSLSCPGRSEPEEAREGQSLAGAGALLGARSVLTCPSDVCNAAQNFSPTWNKYCALLLKEFKLCRRTWEQTFIKPSRNSDVFPLCISL